MSDRAPVAHQPLSAWPDPLGLWHSWLRSFGFAAPLSGDVTQTIDTGLFRAIADQLGFININTRGSGDPELERRITEQVASYGRQLGRVIDAIDVLLRHSNLDAAPPEDRRAIDKLLQMRAEIEELKAQAAAEDVDRLVAEVHALTRDPDANEDALRRLRDVLTED